MTLGFDIDGAIHDGIVDDRTRRRDAEEDNVFCAFVQLGRQGRNEHILRICTRGCLEMYF
jgi:hypothetical protein